MADFPVRTEELSASWLSGVLGAEVKGFRVEPLGAGAGMIGQSARLCIDYGSGASGPATVIVKFPTQTEGNRVVADTFDMYGREVRFYQTIAGQTPARAPRPFHAEMAEENSDFVLLLEDLSACRLGDQLAGADLADAHAAIDQMARLHATWWGRTEDPVLSWIPIHDNPVQAAGMSQGFAAGWPVFLELFGDVLPGGRAEEYARIGPSTADCLRRMCGGVLTVVHGDFRLDNIFFDVPDDPTGVALFDWQGISKSCGPQDLGYFMSQSLRSEVRREYGSALVERYREKLLQAGVEGYSADQCWADYRASVLYLFTFAIVIAGTLDHSNQRGRQMVHALASRSAETIAEIEALALLD